MKLSQNNHCVRIYKLVTFEIWWHEDGHHNQLTLQRQKSSYSYGSFEHDELKFGVL